MPVSDYIVISGAQGITIHDARGQQSTWVVERTYRTFNQPVREIEVQRILSDGSVAPVATSYGDLEELYSEGGFRNLIVRFPEPIQPHTTFRHTVTFSQTKTFFARDLDVNVTPVWSYDEYSIFVHLPENYRCADVKAFKRIGKEKIPCGELRVSPALLELQLRGLEQGITYVLNWTCLDHTTTPGTE